jgi:4'-phosphopantetheinyl transferase
MSSTSGALLSRDEEERADSYRFSGDRERFVFCRGVLRVLLGHYLGEEPGNMRFAYGPLGKPYISEGHRRREVSFSLSHSHEFALFAFTGERQVGVDLEHIRPLPNVDEMARRLFSEDDYESFQRLPREMRETIYLRAWTLNEARFKALGYEFSDLQVRLRDVVEPKSSPRLMNSTSFPEGSLLSSFQPLPDYVASLCVTAS